MNKHTTVKFLSCSQGKAWRTHAHTDGRTDGRTDGTTAALQYPLRNALIIIAPLKPFHKIMPRPERVFGIFVLCPDFLCPLSKYHDWGHIFSWLSFCLSVCLICFQLSYTYSTIVWVYWCFTSHATIFQSYKWRIIQLDKDFIFHMPTCTQLMMPFQISPRSATLRPLLWLFFKVLP